MIRLQIIILSFIAFLLVTLLSGHDKNKFTTDYDLRFVCSLKIDLDRQSVNFKIKNSGEEKKISVLVSPEVSSSNPEFKLSRNTSRYHFDNTSSSPSKLAYNSSLKTDSSYCLISPRSPPALA